jgi:tRNA (cmo5U34)-methyltransferase
MLARSIPQYGVMRETVASTALSVLAPGRSVVDLGCSRGEGLARLRSRLVGTRLVGVEVSKPMHAVAAARFDGDSDVSIVERDLRDPFPWKLYEPVGVVLSVLTLQFIPIEHRLRLVSEVHDALASGGAFVLVEKVLGATARLDRLMVERHYAMKRANGYSDDEIARKRLALEGVLVPVTAHWNEELLRSAGLAEVDSFWRWMNFAGWVAVKAR